MAGMEIPLAAVAVGASVGGTALSAYGQEQAGQQQANAAKFQQQQYEQQAKIFATEAAQSEAKRRADLTSSLSAIQAIQAGRGVGAASPGTTALIDSVTSGAERDIQTEKVNFLLKGDNARMAALMSGNQAQYSLLAGDIGAAATIFGGVSKAAGMYTYGAKSIR